MHFGMHAWETKSGYAEIWCIDCADAHNKPQYGPMPPPMVTNPRKVHEPTARDSREIEWMNLRPLSATKRPIKQTGFVAPLGALEGIDHMVARIETIKRLTDEQERDRATHRAIVEADKELPFIVDEFKANGFRSLSLSSSQTTTKDDEIEAANFAEHHLKTIPYGFGQKGVDANGFPIYNNLEELPGILRRIDWEKNESRNGPISKVLLIEGPGDTLSATVSQPWMMKHIDIAELKRLGKKTRDACRYKTFSELDNARAKVEYYNAIGSAIYRVYHGEVLPEQTMNALGAEDLTVPKRERALPPERRSEALVAQGEQELGLHAGTNDTVIALMTDDDTLLLGYTQGSVEGRESDDPLSAGSRLWRSAKNGRRWVAP
jgi:hypothetical protein